MKKRVLKNLMHIGIAAVFLLAVWWIAYLWAGNPLHVPPLQDCLKELGALLADGGFWTAFWGTMGRVFIAFVISFAFALGCALLAYILPAFRQIFAPIVSVVRSVPVLAVLLILIVVWGTEHTPIAVAFLSLFPMLYAGILAALSAVDSQLVEMSRVYKVPMRKRVFQLYLPSAAPFVLQESGAALGFSIKLVVSAEVIARTAKSIGGMMNDARVLEEMPALFALVIAAFAAAFALEWCAAAFAGFAERRVK